MLTKLSMLHTNLETLFELAKTRQSVLITLMMTCHLSARCRSNLMPDHRHASRHRALRHRLADLSGPRSDSVTML